MKILTAEQMREADRRTIVDLGIPGVVLMESAGRAVAGEILQRYSQLAPGPVLLLCGKGNNGGDGLVVARTLLQQGWQVTTVLFAAEAAISGDARLYLDILQRLDAPIEYAEDVPGVENLLTRLPVPALIVDALFGTGLSSPVSGHYAAAIDWMNRSPALKVAIDIPSGLDASSGAILGSVLYADLTVTLAAAKLGQVIYPGVTCCGELVVAEIGIPQAVLDEIAAGILLEAGDVRGFLPARPEVGHKGTFGHLLLVAGSCGKSGAAALAARAALRAGAGLVTVATPASQQATLAVKLTEAMISPLDEVAGELAETSFPQIARLWQDKKVLAIGPGLGRSIATVALVQKVIKDCPLPLVIDADALFALAGSTELLMARPVGTTILTPHPGEMAHLLGISVADVESDRVGMARRFAETHGVILVLKGARTVIAAPDGGIMINPTGHAGMASGGMGDLLTGIIAALLCQGAPPLAAAAAAVWLHGRCGDRLRPRFGDAGLLASDLLVEIPGARCEIISL
ncbi:MAG: bifunctional ADP-dependent NAD(P)H-hydrate dehydratase/NAD(P)H-hydrate epimerase [Deltaproteobacteria bacterium HGW-Deltaproteobacteria-4]|nr:MAG: bifunctional ADP-dependent NAD(P)H-hydrate dehydratase/NAD(P)H-hydrate epimerase [Deltaproteobacteria bacterium HGW-Deltaproteobacteria-4]